MIRAITLPQPHDGNQRHPATSQSRLSFHFPRLRYNQNQRIPTIEEEFNLDEGNSMRTLLSNLLYSFVCCFFCFPSLNSRHFDLRVSILLLCKQQPLALFTISNIILLSLVISVYIVETSTSKPDLKFWLVVMTSRCLFRNALQFVTAAAHRGCFELRNMHVIQKSIEIADVFGMIWFSVGNLMLFNCIGVCKSSNPFSFYVTLVYMVNSYAYAILPIIIKLSIFMIPPSNDPRFITNVNIPVRVLHGRNNPVTSVMNIDELNATISLKWKLWLEEYGCDEVLYSDYVRDRKKCHSESQESVIALEDRDRYMDRDIDVDRDANEERSNAWVDAEGNVIIRNAHTHHDTPEEYCPICLDPFQHTDEATGTATSRHNESLEKHQESSPEGNINDNEIREDENKDGNTECEKMESANLRGVSLTDESNNDLQRQVDESGVCSQTDNENRNDQRMEDIPNTTISAPMNIVAFPCSAEHIFHKNCLHLWLETSITSSTELTCPCCRARPMQRSQRMKRSTSSPSPETSSCMNPGSDSFAVNIR